MFVFFKVFIKLVKIHNDSDENASYILFYFCQFSSYLIHRGEKSIHMSGSGKRLYSYDSQNTGSTSIDSGVLDHRPSINMDSGE